MQWFLQFVTGFVTLVDSFERSLYRYCVSRAVETTGGTIRSSFWAVQRFVKSICQTCLQCWCNDRRPLRNRVAYTRFFVKSNGMQNLRSTVTFDTSTRTCHSTDINYKTKRCSWRVKNDIRVPRVYGSVAGLVMDVKRLFEFKMSLFFWIFCS